MSDSFWIFCTVAVFMGMLPAIIGIVAKHKMSMKQLELEGLKIRHAHLPAEHEDAAN